MSDKPIEPSQPQRPALRVLSIAHTAVSRDAGRLRYEPLAQEPGLDMHLVVPSRWYQFGRWQDADSAEGSPIPVHVLPIRLARLGRIKWYGHTYAGLGRLIRRLRPEVIHLWEEPWSFVALQAVLLRRSSGAALVLEVDQNILKWLPPPFGWIRNFVLKRTTMVLSRSPEATAVVRACGFNGPVTPIGYGVDQRVFHPATSPENRLRRPVFSIGYVGRLVPEKGLDDALVALKLTRQPLQLSIMGEGPHEAALRQHASALGVQDRVSFRGWGTPEEVAGFLRGLDALILLTRTDHAVREQFGRVILEAQACGIPVIGSTSGAIPDVVGPGGWIVPERDPAALATLIDRLATNPAEIGHAGEAGIRNVVARFTYAAIAQALLSAWRTAGKLERPETGDDLRHANPASVIQTLKKLAVSSFRLASGSQMLHHSIVPIRYRGGESSDPTGDANGKRGPAP